MSNETTLLTALTTGQAINPEFQPQNNKQAYLAYLNGLDISLPEPRTAEEVLLYNLCMKGIGGGSSGTEDFEITDVGYLFYGGRSALYNELVSRIVPPTDVQNMFNAANDNPDIDFSRVDFSKCKQFSYMFYQTNLKKIDVSSVDMSSMGYQGANYMFAHCKAEEILGVGRNARMDYYFRDWLMNPSESLRRLTLSPDVKFMNQYIDISNCSFTRETMVELFNSLPATCTSTITITGNPCLVDGSLTAEDRAIATDKGCTIVEA